MPDHLSLPSRLKPSLPLPLALSPAQHLVIAAVGGTCKLFLHAGARTSVEGSERMAAALARPPGQGLITVSNHVGSIDDPLITTSSEFRALIFEVDLGPRSTPRTAAGQPAVQFFTAALRPAHARAPRPCSSDATAPFAGEQMLFVFGPGCA